MFLQRRQWLSVLSKRQRLGQFYLSRPFSSYNPQRPRRDLYDYEEEQSGDDGWRYERTWRDRLYDHRRALARVGIFAFGAGSYYWYHLEPTPITGNFILI